MQFVIKHDGNEIIFSNEQLLGDYLAKQDRNLLKQMDVFSIKPLTMNQVVRIMNRAINKKAR